MAFLSVERRIDALQKARELISDPQRLSRGAMWRNAAGHPVSWPDQAVCHSIMGATAAVLPNLSVCMEVDIELLETVFEHEWADDLEAFNDRAEHWLIMQCFELTIARLREEARELQEARR